MIWLLVILALVLLVLCAFAHDEIPRSKAAKQPRPAPPPLPDDWSRDGPINR